MIFATPLGLLALLAIPAIVTIHLFRRRFPTRHIAGLFLWQTTRTIPEGGGKVSRLPITTSLILECLAALALALILAGARISSASASHHLVVLLDDSASMAAVNARGESARDRAAQRALHEIDRLGPTGRVTLVRSGDRPSVLSGPAALAVEARSALDTWRPDAPHHSMALGVRLARELAGQRGRLMVVSDVPLGAGETFEGGLWVSVGEGLPNVGITGAQRSLSPNEGRGVVSLTVANYSDTSARRQVTISSGDKPVLTTEVETPPGISSLNLPLPPGLPSVRVALADDALARDNSVVLAEPRPQIVGVANELQDARGRDALSKGLSALSGVTATKPGHLLFADAEQLDRPSTPGTWRVGFGRPPAKWLGAGEARDFVGPFLLEKRHPLLLGVTLDGVVWTGAVPMSGTRAMSSPSAAALRPIATAGDQVLIAISGTSSSASREPAILLNLDLARTNLIRAPDWPILISNLVEMRRQNLPGPERWNYRVGEWVRVRLARDPKAALRFRCGEIERALPSSRQLEFIAPSPGGLLQILEGDEILFELGVNFLDAAEADLRAKARGEAGAMTETARLRAEGGAASDPLFWVLLSIAGVAVLVNWCVFTPATRRA